MFGLLRYVFIRFITQSFLRIPTLCGTREVPSDGDGDGIHCRRTVLRVMEGEEIDFIAYKILSGGALCVVLIPHYKTTHDAENSSDLTLLQASSSEKRVEQKLRCRVNIPEDADDSPTSTVKVERRSLRNSESSVQVRIHTLTLYLFSLLLPRF